MKKIYLFIVALLAMTASCSDFLDQDNRSNVPTDDFYNTETGFESLTNAMYSSLRELYNQQPNLFVGGTDLYGDGKSQSVEMTYYTYTTDNSSIENFYTTCYKGIQLANTVIAYGETTEDSDARLQYIDEARFIRAWYYFQLVQQFGKVALSNEMYTSAVMSHPRNTLEEVYDFIISEFTYLVSSESNLLSRSAATAARANLRAANFFLAKAYLTRGWLDGTDYESQEETVAESGDFENALKYALVAIDGETPSTSIEDAFDISNEASDEFFWSVQFSSDAVDDPGDDGSYQQAQFGAYLGGSEKPRNKAIDGNYSPLLHFHQLFTRGDGRYEQTFMMEFHEAYFDFYSDPESSEIIYYYAPWWATDDDIAEWKADDPNGIKTNTLVTLTIEGGEGSIAPSNGQVETYTNRRSMDLGVPCIRKFDDYSETSISNRSTTCSMHDVVVARLGEAYLIAAEAYLKQSSSNPSKAAEMINTLRERPGTVKDGYEDDMTVSASDMTIQFILDERARELAGEYVRWTDLKRTHLLFENFIAYQEDDVPESNLKGTDGCWKSLRPIPQAAIDLNKAEVEQNPGY